MITSSLRQGMFMFFIIMLIFVGTFFFEMSMFQIFIIICLAGVILKLTDIEEAIRCQ